MLMAMRRPVASASHPITGGPTRKPKKLMLETMVIAMLALMVPNFPAILYQIGTDEEMPKPTSRKPKVAGMR